jgi:ACT domain-containing protein
MGAGFFDYIMTTKNKDLVQLGVLMTRAQLKKIDVSAKKFGLSRSAYVRWVLFLHKMER